MQFASCDTCPLAVLRTRLVELPAPPEWATRAQTWLPAERPAVPTVAVPPEAEVVTPVPPRGSCHTSSNNLFAGSPGHHQPLYRSIWADSVPSYVQQSVISCSTGSSWVFCMLAFSLCQAAPADAGRGSSADGHDGLPRGAGAAGRSAGGRRRSADHQRAPDRRHRHPCVPCALHTPLTCASHYAMGARGTNRFAACQSNSVCWHPARRCVPSGSQT